MTWTRARDLHRLLLASALVVKGLSWPAAPPEVALALVITAVVALHGRWARPAFGLAAVIVWAAFVTGSHRSNHFALMGLLSTIAVLMGNPTRARGDDLGVLLTMVQVSTVYAFAGVWKLNPEFLSGAVLNYEWHRSWLLGPASAPRWVLVGAAIVTIVGELVLIALLWRRSLVRAGVALGTVLHIGMILTIGGARHTTGELIAFALLCASSYPFFIARSAAPPPGRGSSRRWRPRLDRAASSGL